MQKEYLELIKRAEEVKQNSYSPYSKLKIGAALLAENGKIFTGTNVENASYCLSICAERSAISNAVSTGEKFFKALAVVSESEKLITPCGACRQVFMEFNPEMDIIVSNKKETKIFKAKDLLQDYFTLN